jgi:hypothetical protein
MPDDYAGVVASIHESTLARVVVAITWSRTNVRGQVRVARHEVRAGR